MQVTDSAIADVVIIESKVLGKECGTHNQINRPKDKLIRVVQSEIFDTAVHFA